MMGDYYEKHPEERFEISITIQLKRGFVSFREHNDGTYHFKYFGLTKDEDEVFGHCRFESYWAYQTYKN